MNGRGGKVALGLTALSLLALVGLPLAFVLLQAIFPGLTRGSLDAPFARLFEVLASPHLLHLTRNTVLLGVSVTLGCFLLALPLGVLRALFHVPFARGFDMLLIVPFLIPPYIAALAWIMTLQPRGYAQRMLGFDLGGFLFSFAGIVFVMVLNLFPVVYFALSRTLEVVGGRFGEVGRVFGATPLRCFLRITVPLATPAIAASLLLVFALSIEEFGTPAILGSRTGFFVLVNGIHQGFADWPIDITRSAILSLVLVALALCAHRIQHLIATRRSYVAIAGKPVEFERRALGRWRIPAAALFAAVVLLAVVVPIAAVTITASTRTVSGGLALANFSTVHFARVLAGSHGAMRALANSLTLALLTALATGVLGALVAYLVVRSAVRGRGLLDALSLLPNAVPGIVVAVGLILAWNQPFWPVRIYNTPAILLLAYACLLLPYPVRYAVASLRQIGDSLDAAARVAGAGFARTFLRVLLPLMMPALLAAMLLVFAIATRELVASIMLAPAGFSTVSTFVFNQFEQGSPGMGMAMSVIAIFSSTLLLVLLAVWTRSPGFR